MVAALLLGMPHGPHRHADLASQAGLSVATVDRVINGRPGVSARAVRAVERALIYEIDRQAKALDAGEQEVAKVKKSATDDLKVVPARPASSVTTEDLPKSPSMPPGKDDDTGNKRGKRERE